MLPLKFWHFKYPWQPQGLSLYLHAPHESQSIQEQIWHMTGLVSLHSHGRRFHNSFLLSLTLKPEPGCAIFCLMNLKHDLLVQLYPHQISICQGFLEHLTFSVLGFTMYIWLTSNSEFHMPPPQWHTSSNNAIPIPKKPYLLLVSISLQAIFLKSANLTEDAYNIE